MPERIKRRVGNKEKILKSEVVDLDIIETAKRPLIRVLKVFKEKKKKSIFKEKIIKPKGRPKIPLYYKRKVKKSNLTPMYYFYFEKCGNNSWVAFAQLLENLAKRRFVVGFLSEISSNYKLREFDEENETWE